MRRKPVRIWGLLVLLALGAGGPARSAEPVKEDKPIVVKSRSLEIDDTQKRVVFKGEVNARSPDFVIDCDQLSITYEQAPAKKGDKAQGNRIDTIEALGNVVIDRVEGGVATAQKAVFYQKEEKIVLTGGPVVKQGADSVEGDRITLFIKENRSVIEGLQERKVKATIFPKGDMSEKIGKANGS